MCFVKARFATEMAVSLASATLSLGQLATFDDGGDDVDDWEIKLGVGSC